MIRLAELMGALSLATDLGTGQPLEHAQRTAILAVRLGEAAGLSEAERKDAYYLSLLRMLGCHADAPLAADIFGASGDELATLGALAASDWGDPVATLGALFRQLGAGLPPLQRGRALVNGMVKMPRLMKTPRAHCEVARTMARDLGFEVRVLDAIIDLFERWDGKGMPNRKRGDAIARPARLVMLAYDLQIHHRFGGADGALEMARARREKAHDPSLVDALLRAPEVLGAAQGEALWESALAAEPGAPEVVPAARLDDALRVMGAFADLKSPYTAGHSSGVAELAAAAGERARLGADEVLELRRAGFLHDLGRAGITSTIWEKPGPLSDGERERVRLHAYYTERILARPSLLARLAALASADHERVDGSGYPRRVRGDGCSFAARILAAADVYHAMREDRPQRPAHTRDQAADELRAEARAGRLDADAVAAVLAAAGHRGRVARAERPGGLSDREVEVLGRLARGMTNKEIAVELGCAPRTVAHHLEHIYDKLGVSTRAAAVTFALQRDLVRDPVRDG